MPNMIEKVAMALARNELTDLGRKAFDANPKEYFEKSFSSKERTHYEALACIAIEAMREPSEEMINAGIFHGVDNGFGVGYDDYNNLYQAMFDAALKADNVVALK